MSTRKPISQQAMFEQPPASTKERPAAQRAVMAYCRGWKDARGTTAPRHMTGQIARTVRQLLDQGRDAATVIEAAERCGRKGFGATGLGREVADLEARRATFDGGDELERMNREGL